MRYPDLFEIALPMAVMKTVTVPGANDFNPTPEMIAAALLGVLALIVLYVFIR